MNATAIALVGYIVWGVLLVGGIAVLRTAVSLARHRPINLFRVDGTDISPFGERLSRAHANWYESFPALGGLLLLALATDNTSITETLAYALLISRVIQSSIHLYSTSLVAGLFRFGFFFIQMAIAVYWASLFVARYSV